MNWLLSISLLILMIIAYRIDGQCYLSPIFIFSFIFFISSIAVSINTSYWEYEISLKTVIFIITSYMFFSLGYLLFRNSGQSITIKDSGKYKLSDVEFVSIPVATYIVFILYGLVTLILFYIQQRSNAASIGMGGSITEIIFANRYSVDDAADSSLIRFMFIFLKIITYVTVSIYFYNSIVFRNKSHSVLTIVLIVVYFLCCLLTTNRSDIIGAASSMVFIILYFTYYKNRWAANSKNNRQMIFRIVLIGAGGLFLFRRFGTFSGKSSMYSAYDNICNYVGGPIVCLDKFLTNTGVVIGRGRSFSSLFNGVLVLLRKIGIGYKVVGVNMPHQYWNHGAANTYTSLVPYYDSIGLVGMLFIEFAFGALYGAIWKKVQGRRVSWIQVLFYGDTFFYYLCMVSMAERICAQLISITVFVEFISISIMVRLLKKSEHEARTDD